MADYLWEGKYMFDRQYVDFNFTMDEEIPEAIAFEFVAMKQLVMAIFGMLEPYKRKSIIDSLSKIDTPQMQDLVKNLELITKQ